MTDIKNHPALPAFRPWLSNLIWSFYGIVFIWLAWRFLYQNDYIEAFLGAVVVSALMVTWQWKTFMARSHGQRVEREAIKALGKIVGDKLRSGVPLPGRGDIDAVLTLAEQTFNIEIKSIQDADRVTKKHADQALAASVYLSTTPVIWLPRAQVKQIKNKNGVRVFGGSAKDFAKFLGC